MPNLRRVPLLAALVFASAALPAQQPAHPSLGIFQGATDIGITHKGRTLYDPATDTYGITGGGADMWGTADAFHFTWLPLTGDATLEADVTFPSGADAPKEKAVLLFRQSLDPGSPYADIAIHGDGHITLQYRATPSGITADQTLPEHTTHHLRIVRHGDTFTATAGDSTSSTTVALHGPIYVGIGVCAHNPDSTGTVAFSNLKLTRAVQTDSTSK